MNYSYYNQAPMWGTQAYQLAMPPAPGYQPQPSWGGLDYYRAHLGSSSDECVSSLSVYILGEIPDLVPSTIFDYAWNQLKRLAGGGGRGKTTARYWHRMIYGGLVSRLFITLMIS